MTNVATRFQPDISGSAVPTGFVGEVRTQTWTGQSIVTSSGTLLATITSVPIGTYLAIIDTDVTFGSATRIIGSVGGTATFVTSKATAGDFVRAVDTTSSGFYQTYAIRVTASGTLTFAASSVTANTTADCRGSFTIVRIV